MFRDLPPFFERACPLISLPIYHGLTFLLRQCHGNHDLIHVISCHNLRHFMRKYRSWKQEKEKNAYLIEIEEILPAYSLSCIKGNRLRKE